MAKRLVFMLLKCAKICEKLKLIAKQNVLLYYIMTNSSMYLDTSHDNSGFMMRLFWDSLLLLIHLFYNIMVGEGTN